MSAPRVRVVIPTLNEAEALPGLLDALRGADAVIVADGGSTDGTARIAAERGARVVEAPRGRGRQLAAGAAAAGDGILWFVHADAIVPPGALEALRATSGTWGCFRARIASRDPRLVATAAIMNLRARHTGSCTGDMGIWARREAYDAAGGFPPLDALEDLVFARRAHARAPCTVLAPALGISARRWERHGVARTLARTTAIRLGWALGVSPERLARAYRGR